MTYPELIDRLKLIRLHFLEMEPWFDTPKEHRRDEQAMAWKETHLRALDLLIKSSEE